MKYAIDETELARLEELAGKASKGPFFVIEADDAMSMSSIYVSTESKEYELGEKPESVVAVTLAQSGGRVACHHDFLWLENAHYIAAACNAVPALIAEVRRLRRNYECSEKSLQRHEHMIAELMEKVEAWEWFGECFDNCKQRGKLPLEVHKTPSAYSEAWASLWAAREAVHADRE